MGKPSKKKDGGVGGGKPSTASLWAICAVVLLAFAYMSLSSMPKKSPKAKKETVEDETIDEAEKLDMVRDALMNPDGKSAYDPESRTPAGFGGSRFAAADYWEERYSKQQKPYDWYGTWDSPKSVTIKRHVQLHLPAPSAAVRLLNIGCGSSRLAEELSSDGFGNITNVDISKSVVEKMAKKFEGRAGVRFQQMDITKMEFTSGSFDVVFDKGTLDALYTGASESVQVAVAEVFRVLAPGGTFVSMSFGLPKSRKELNTTLPNGDVPGGPPGVPIGWARFHTIAVRKDGQGVTALDGSAGPVEPTREHFYVYVMTKSS